MFETFVIKISSTSPRISPSSIRQLHLTDLGSVTAIFQRVTEEPLRASAQTGNMIFCLPAWVIRVVSHNPEHIAALPGSPLFRDGGRMGLVLGTTVLPHQDGTHLMLLCLPGGIQKPFQEDNQCRFLFPPDPAKKKASFRVVLASPLRLAQLLTAFSPEWQLHCKYRTLLSLYKNLVYFSN